MADFDDVTDKASLKYNPGTFCDAYICMYILKREKKICDKMADSDDVTDKTSLKYNSIILISHCDGFE